MPLLTCSSLLLFYSLLLCLSCVWMSVSTFSFLYGRFWALTLGYVNVFWLLIYAFSFSLAPAALLCTDHFSFKLLLSVHCLSLPLCPCATALTCCCVTCMTSVILLTFSSSTLTVCKLSLRCVSCVHVFSLLSPRLGPKLLHVFSNVSSVVPC